MRFGRTLVSFVGLTALLLSGELWLRNALAFNTGRIVFTSTRDGNTEIYVMDADGGNQERLTNHPAADSNPTWSPDRTKIAFVSDRNRGFVQIHVMDADGKNPIQLTDGLWETAPDWSLVGQKIAFISRNAQANPHVTVMDADGQNVFRLAVGDEPSWSPDGKRVAFESLDEEGHRQIYVINANGQGFERVTHDLQIKKEPAWSPNGRKIAYAFQDEGPLGFFQIYVMDADGKNRKWLTRKQAHNRADNRQPTWSPDGRTIAYVIYKYDDAGRFKRTIHLMTVDGQYLKQLSDGHDGHDYHPDFGPVGLAVSPTSDKNTIWGRLKKVVPDLR